MVGGPVGAVVGGVAGAMIGNAAAEGQHPIETAVTRNRSVAEKPLKRAVKTAKKIAQSKASQLKSAVKKKSLTSTKPNDHKSSAKKRHVK